MASLGRDPLIVTRGLVTFLDVWFGSNSLKCLTSTFQKWLIWLRSQHKRGTDLYVYQFVGKVWGLNVINPNPSTQYKPAACLKNTWSETWENFKNEQFCVAAIDWGHITERTGADSPPSSSHAMHQNNWQYPIILWSVYRRSDGPPENKSAIRKPGVWITDVMPAGHRVDKIGQRQRSKKRRQLFP